MPTSESRRSSLLSRLREGLEYVALVATASVLGVVPRRVALALGAIVGQLGWWSRIRRRRVLANLEVAFPTSSDVERRRLGARAARNFGRTVCEFLRFARADRRRVLDLVEIDGLDVVRKAQAEGRGVALVTAHLGAWALYVTALAAAGVPSALLVGVQRNRRVNDLIGAIPGSAIQLISKSRTAPREILAALQASKVIVMVADHYSSDQRVLVPFLGRDAYSLPLPGSLVARHRVPLLGMFGHRVEGGRHRLAIRRLEVPPAGTVESTRVAVALTVNHSIGTAVLAHPDQYFWYHDRWKARDRPQARPPLRDTASRGAAA